MAEPPEPGTVADRAYRRRFRDKGDKREDYAVDLLREARASLADARRVDRILIELGRLYNPLIDGPIVDLATRRRVMEALGAGRAPEAGRLLDERLALYNPLDGPAPTDLAGPDGDARADP